LNVLDQDLGGCEDGELWKIVQGENRFFVTGDKGFGNIRLYPPNSHGGILLVRPDDDGIEPIVELLGKVFSAYDLQDLRGAITVVTSRGVRVRRM
jgi:hypothetical protein